MASTGIRPIAVASGIALSVMLLIGSFGAGLSAQAASASAATVGDRGGVAANSSLLLWESDADLARDLDAVAASGARWIRFDFDWASAEPVAGSYRWSVLDRVVQGSAARGLQILATPAYTPEWARPSGTTDKTPPSDVATYAAFVGAAVRRYSPLGVHAWEIWNEPNNSIFWQPGVDPAAYARLLVAASAAVHGADPSATVISAGLAPEADALPSSLSPRTFLDSLYGAGAGPSFDAVGIHPYDYPYGPAAVGPWNQWQSLPATQQVLAKHGDGAKKIWGTEYGAPTGTNAAAVTETAQATTFVQAYGDWIALPFTGPLFWYAHRDSGTDLADTESNFGLLRNDWSPKPAYGAFRAEMTQSLHAAPPAPPAVASPAVAPPTGPHTAPQAGAHGYLVASADGSVHRFVSSAVAAGAGVSSATAGHAPGAVVGAASVPSGVGYWQVTANGEVLATDAASYGSLAGKHLNSPIVGMAGTASGSGYWLVAADGGIFSFGDAAFHGSTGALHLNSAIVGMAGTASGAGYVIAAADGGIFPFGDATFLGAAQGPSVGIMTI
ncbi:MAG: hypothetical protein NVS3B21_03180 [Acidimicrobiales bacterium]